MEYICRICSKLRPKTAFTEKSHTLHTCKACYVLHHLRTEERKQLDEIFGIFTQTRITKSDKARLEILGTSRDPKVSLHANLILEASQLRPYKKGRHTFLEQKHPDLAKKIEEAGLAYPQAINESDD